MTKLLLSMFIVGVFVLPDSNCRAADADHATAYTALRSMAKSLGGDALNRVVEVTGRGGMPQPATWRITISEGAKGTREIKFAGAKIVSQKTSSQATSLMPIRLTDLNLDSSGAFDAANEQARQTRVPFTALDYSLRVSETTGKPVWDLTLINNAGAHVGGVRLAAHDGEMIATTGFDQAAPGGTVRPLVSADGDHDSVQPTRVNPARSTTTTTTTYNTVHPAPSPEEDDDQRHDRPTPPASEGGFFSRAGRTLDHTTDTVTDTLNRTSHTVDRTVRQTGAKLQRFFTGHNDQDN